jgi:hypothetical protein
MDLRFYEDKDIGQPHIYGHGLYKQELNGGVRR